MDSAVAIRRSSASSASCAGTRGELFLSQFSAPPHAKNLREPRTLSYVAFARWHRNGRAQPGLFNFSVSFLEIDDAFDDLTTQQVKGLQALIDRLPERQRPSTFVAALPGNRRVRVRVADGDALMMRHGPGPFLVQPVVEECKQAVVLKLLEHSRKALMQLYFAEVPEDSRKLLFVRCKPPEEIAAIGEAATVRVAVAQHFEAFFRQFFPNLSVTIMHTLEDPATAPRPNWGLKHHQCHKRAIRFAPICASPGFCDTLSKCFRAGVFWGK